ncbi:MAG: DUF342 domain-containing protein [Planctomycetes bacterium]|nr:DUF342 domain-containing protein [Planctomycetota bacterium]
MPPEPAAHELTITIAPDGLSVTLCIPPGVPMSELGVDTVREAVKERGVLINGEREELIKQVVEKIDPIREEMIEVVVATGQAPEHAQDGFFVLDEALEKPETAPPEDQPNENKDGVDHYAQSHFTVVAKEQRIGVIVLPTEPVDGEDVAGKTIGARLGKPCGIRVDKSIRTESDGTLIADTWGVLQRTGDSLRIEESLEINGPVDFSTGNIDFPGSVTVSKGVRDCFVVRCQKSLEVRELVEAATLHAVLNVTLHRGASGRGKGQISAGQDLHAKYLDGVRADIGRDAFVANEINECDVRIGRALNAPRCTIVGGSIVVGATCEIEQLGGEGGVTTDIAIGRHQDLESLALAMIRLTAQIDRERARLAVKCKKMQCVTGEAALEFASQLTEMTDDLMLLDASRSDINGALNSIAELVGDDRDKWLLVQKDIYEGVRVWLGEFRADFKQDIKGPVKIFIGPNGEPQISEVDQSTTVPLATVARMVEDDRFVHWAQFRTTSDESADFAA